VRLCFDLDNTLCTGYPYEQAEPISGAAELLLDLRDAGHTIIIATARGMGTHNNNPGAARAAIGLLTLKQLESWGFVYDEIYFGKPGYDIVFDDKAYLPGMQVGSVDGRVLSCEQMRLDLSGLM
jgi:hypothetical protein